MYLCDTQTIFKSSNKTREYNLQFRSRCRSICSRPTGNWPATIAMRYLVQTKIANDTARQELNYVYCECKSTGIAYCLIEWNLEHLNHAYRNWEICIQKRENTTRIHKNYLKVSFFHIHVVRASYLHRYHVTSSWSWFV